VEVDCGIPLEAFAAVAEILSYVYNTNAKIKGRKKSDGDDA
jgi:type III secretion system FlhB-like substrate exporter